MQDTVYSVCLVSVELAPMLTPTPQAISEVIQVSIRDVFLKRCLVPEI